MVKGFHHVGVICEDIEQSKRFFTDVLGGKLLYDAGTTPPGYLDERVGIPGAIGKKAVVKIGGSVIELVEYLHPKTKPKGLSAAGIGTLHLAIEVDDIDSEVEKLRKKGVKFNSPPTLIKKGPDKGWVWCYFNSPDGHQLELVENRNLKVPL
jgi:glyoxylase I family protein